MNDEEPPRSAAARAAAELALVRVVHHYGGRPEFVLLGGLVPALLCSQSRWRHAGTTDIDVQVDLEIAGGTVQAARLEQALRRAEFEPSKGVWRWTFSDPSGVRAVVKFELLADLDDKPNEAVVSFDGCEQLGALNLRGTGSAAQNVEVRRLTANDHGVWREADVNVTGLAGFLLAKLAAAYGRQKPKDWYDIAFVLLHNDYGDALAAAARVLEVFGPPIGVIRTQLIELAANFENATAQGTRAYVGQFTDVHPDVDEAVAAADAQLAVAVFTRTLLD